MFHLLPTGYAEGIVDDNDAYGFLVGESLMRQAVPGAALTALLA